MGLDKSILWNMKKIYQIPFQKKRQRGMALIMVLSTITFVILFVQETVFETQVEYRSAVHELNSLRAYHAAKSGLEVSLLRIKTYIKINTAHSNQINMFRSYIDLIWRFPFIWPPPIPDGLNSIEAKKFTEIKQKSFMQTDFITSLEPESGRIDINDLSSPIPSLRMWTFDTLSRLISYLILNNKNLSDEVNENQITEILVNITDWIDPDTQVSNQVSLPESSLYKDNISPPNRSFISLEELRQVAGVSDALYEAIIPFITIYGEKGLNINTAPVELLVALHSDFPLELAQEIYALTSSNPLKPFVFTKNSFSQFLIERGFDNLEQYFFPKDTNTTTEVEVIENIGARVEAEAVDSIPYINFNAPHHFRIKSTGFAGNSQKTITVTYFDTAFSNKQFNSLMQAEEKRQLKKIKKKLSEEQVIVSENNQRNSGQGTDTSRNRPEQQLKQNLAPVIIYWKESF